MRCPHCAGEIQDDSRFCGICGREIAASRRPAAPGGGTAVPSHYQVRRGAGAAPGEPSAIELPISRGARWARILAVLALDVVLAGVGLFLILSHVHACDRARGVPATSSIGDTSEARK